MHLSTLRFTPDPACQQQPCLCDEPSAAKGSLQIGLATGDRPAAASVGYIGPDINVDKSHPRNKLLWPTDDPFFFSKVALLLMVHELGLYLFFPLEKIPCSTSDVAVH
jgi:hypothetical protein